MAIHLVQYQPEIPLNTGSIMRTCAATGTSLHLIKPLGFSLDQKAIKRAGANYIEGVDLHIHENWEDFTAKHPQGRLCFCTQHGQKLHDQVDFTNKDQDYFIILGAESTGFPDELWRDHFENCFRVPMKEEVESLNVSNVGAILVYEALRQQGFPHLN